MKLFSYNIILIGFMGAGKSAVSRCLRKSYGMKEVEMDRLIEEREGMSIPDIFSMHGEEYFRNLETSLLIEMQSTENTVVSCGGGAPLREQNVREMKKNGRVVLLTASPETILNRVKHSDRRPLLNGNKNIEFIQNLMEERRPKYEAAADVIIHTDNKTVPEICEELIAELKSAEK